MRPSPRPPIVPERYFKPPTRELCTNAWMTEPDAQQILTPVVGRGEDPKLFYNAFIRLYGVRDRLTYVNELRIMYQHLISIKRTVLALDGPIPAPEPEALAKIRRRGRYNSAEEMIVDLAGNLPGHAREELQRQMQRAFVQVLTDAAKGQPNLNRFLSTVVTLLCHIARYHSALFGGWRETDVPVFMLMGGCQSEAEVLYVRFLSRLPVDVLILAPNLDRPCLLQDERLLELRGEESLPTMKFPRDDAAAQLSTAAAHAERDLDALLYQDTGLYRNRQFARANAVTLRTTADEAFMLWDQELKYRTGFSAEDDVVSMPVIYAKFSGVPRGALTPYWQKVKQLVGKDAFYISNPPMIPAGDGNRMQALAMKALRHGRVSREAIRNERQYPFGLLREDLQAHIFEKLQWMLDRRFIRGTFVNGTEYTVVGTVLGMNRELLRMLQAFDFTKRNPKLVFVYTGESGATLEDAILLTFLNLVGFDIALFVPTGYQVIEGFLADDLPVEHQLGAYVYDLAVPDLNALPPLRGPSLIDRIFRGR